MTSRTGTARRFASADRRDRAIEALWYAAAAFVTSVVAAVVMKLWRAELRVPFLYTWDAVSAQAAAKGMLENGWFFANPHLGAPGTQVAYDYPGAETLNLLTLRVVGLFARDSAATINVFFLLGFPLVALVTFWVARELELSRPSSFLVAVLYSLLPYHFLRGELHLFLSFYVMVPPAILLAFQAMRSDDRLSIFGTSGSDAKIAWPRRLVPIVVCVLIGSAGVYYALFSAFLLFIGAIVAWARTGKARAVLPGLFLVCVIALTIATNISPTVFYQMRNGRNQVAVQRGRSEAQVYGLRIDSLLAPAPGHRVPALAQAQTAYFEWLDDDASSAISRENASQALGALGAVGFLVLLGYLMLRAELVKPGARGSVALLGDAAVLNGAIVLLATAGSVGAIMSYSVPLIRAYNRISVFVALLAFVAIAALFDHFWAPDKRHRLRIVAILAVLAIAVFDQTTPAFAPDYTRAGKEYRADADFVSQVEGSLPAESSVFQLPYVAYPESPLVNKMVDYDHLRAYLHSKTIRWSYGAIKGRESDRWQKEVSSLPGPEMLSRLRAAGFSGLWIDRYGYADKGAALESELSESLGAKGVESRWGRYVFFALQ